MSIRSLFVFALSAVGLLVATAAQAQDPSYGGGRGGEVECRSSNYARQRCAVPWRDARLVRQVSNTQCVRGQNWGVDRQGLWVDRGCVGRFVDASGGSDGGGGSDGRDGRDGRDSRDSRDGNDGNDGSDSSGGSWSPPAGWDHRFQIRCHSSGYQYGFCAVDMGRGGRAYLQRQNSDSACVEGRTWGWNRAGIWVNQGCSGTFTIDRRWR